MTLMWFDALLCFKVPRLARWTVVVVDRNTGADLPMPAVKFRWRRSVDAWLIRELHRWAREGITASMEVRPLATP